MSDAATRLAEQRRRLVQQARADRASLAAAWRTIERPAVIATLWWHRASAWGGWLRSRPWLWALPLAALLVLRARHRPAGRRLGWAVSTALPWLLRAANLRGLRQRGTGPDLSG